MSCDARSLSCDAGSLMVLPMYQYKMYGWELLFAKFNSLPAVTYKPSDVYSNLATFNAHLTMESFFLCQTFCLYGSDTVTI